MKNKFLLAIAAFMLFGGVSCKQQCDETAERKAVELVLENYVIANETKNIDLIREIWAPKNDIIIFGTNSDEKIEGWENIQDTFKKQFETMEEMFISVTQQKIYLNCTGNTAWYSQIMDINYTENGEAKDFEGIRFTGVLEKIDGKWYIVQSHLSIPYRSMEKQKYAA
jgi:ketosteroid isomerase-like protein